MASDNVGAFEALGIIEALKVDDWERAQSRLTEVLSRIDNYFSLFTYVPTLTQGGTSTGGASDFAFLDVKGLRAGPWVFINGLCAPSKTLSAGFLSISLPPQLPALVGTTVGSIGNISWAVSPSVSFNAGDALLLTTSTFTGQADGSVSSMGSASPARTAQAGDVIRFTLQYQTTATPF